MKYVIPYIDTNSGHAAKRDNIAHNAADIIPILNQTLQECHWIHLKTKQIRHKDVYSLPALKDLSTLMHGGTQQSVCAT